MKALFSLLPLLLFTADCNCQLLLPFPDPWPGANKSAVAVDSISGNIFLTTAQSFNPHNKWKLFRYNSALNTYDSLAGSAFGPASVTNKMLFRNGLLYLLNDKNAIRCFNTISNSWIWTSSVDYPAWEKINDIDLKGDTLFAAGDFSGINGTPRWSLAAINRLNGTVISSWDPSQNGLYDFIGTEVIRCSQTGNLYVGGRFTIAGKQNLLGIDIQNETFLTWAPNPNDTVYDLEINSGYIYVSGKFTNIHSTARNRLARINFSGHTLNTFAMGANGVIDDIELYPDQLFLNGSFTQVGTQGRQGLAAISLINNLPTPWNPGTFNSSFKITLLRDKFFVFNESFPAFSVYCLAPVTGSLFTQSDLLVCAGDSLVPYQISPSLNAGGYSWSYSGSGVLLNPTLNSCFLSFSTTATSGILSVTPISTCGTTGTVISISITVQARPSVYAGQDDTLTCALTTVSLMAASSSTNAYFSWNGPQNCPGNCPVFSVSQNGTFYLIVTDTLTGCLNTDTVFVAIDTVLPDVILPPGLFQVDCGGTPVVLDGNTSTSPSSLWWHDIANQNVQADPAIYSGAGTYFLVVEDLSNGCRDSASLLVELNVNTPNSILLSHPANFPLASGYFTCQTDTHFLVADSDTLNTVIIWKNAVSQIVFPNPAAITQAGTYKLIIIRADNQCADSSLFVLLGTDTSPPLYQMPATSSLTCSTNNLLLDATAISPNTSLFWYDTSQVQFPDPFWVGDTGRIWLHAVRADNGCEVFDSIYVGFNPTIEFLLHPDTMVCPGEAAFLQTFPLGNLGGLQFQWSNGDTTSQTIVYPNQSQIYWVQVSDSTVCLGTDSFNILLPPLYSDSVIAFTNCNGSDSGSIVILPSGGMPPYVFSIDSGSSFQLSNTFGNIPFGNYQITIRDSLGCNYYASVTLNDSSTALTAQFLICTDVHVGDTLIAVDISIPIPDSIDWVVTGQVIALTSGLNEFMPTDTGLVFIRMEAYYDDCVISSQKYIYVLPLDTDLATFYNQNGIRAILLSPNPNSGQFQVEVSLFKKQDLVVQILNPSGIILEQMVVNETDFFIRNYSIQNPSPGIYRVRVIAEFDSKTISFVIPQ